MFKVTGSDGRQYGPATAEDIRRWIAENRVTAQTLLLAEGTTEWKPLGAFAEFALESKTTPPPIVAPPPTAASSRANNKVAAGICGILLGHLGIHKFILGYTTAGLIMLLVNLPTCGIGGVIMWVIGLIEGIIYLTKTDDEFVRTYVDGRREWF
jgi:TM2 domain-containing membrane protein YozV